MNDALVPEPAPAPPAPPADAARSRRRRTAWIVAIAADALQLAAFPLFGGGALSPANDVLDVVVSIVMVRLLGWHPALLPSLVAELIPGVDLVPTWTAAVGLVALTSRTPKPKLEPRPESKAESKPKPESSAEVL